MPEIEAGAARGGGVVFQLSGHQSSESEAGQAEASSLSHGPVDT